MDALALLVDRCADAATQAGVSRIGGRRFHGAAPEMLLGFNLHFALQKSAGHWHATGDST